MDVTAAGANRHTASRVGGTDICADLPGSTVQRHLRRLQWFAAPRVIGQTIRRDDFPNAFFKNQLSGPRYIGPASGRRSEKRPRAKFGQIARAAEAALRRVVARRVGKTLCVDRPAAGV